MANYYQVGMYAGEGQNPHDDTPIGDLKKAGDLAEQIGIQIVEAVDEENGQYLAILPKLLEEAFLKGGDLEIKVNIDKFGPWGLTAEAPDERVKAAWEDDEKYGLPV